MSRKHFKRLFCRQYMKTTGFYAISVDDTLYIHKYLMKKNSIV